MCVERQPNKVALGEVTNTIDFNSSLTSDGVEESMFFYVFHNGIDLFKNDLLLALLLNCCVIQ